MPINRLRLVGLAVLLALIASPGALSAQGRGDQSKNDDNKQRDKDKAKAEKDAKRYDKFKTYAMNRYQTDLDFREEVDGHFDDVLRDHSIQAFNNNSAEPARPTVVHDGDRLRLQKGLYDNKLVADYINQVGQRLVPADSDKLFAFRLVAHPIPFAETLSTGTIYISTGLVSLLDNEAQLAYVLAHEMGHVQLDHWKLKSVLSLAQEDYEKRENRKLDLITAGLGALAGVAAGKASGANAATVAQLGAVGAVVGVATVGAWRSALALDWDTVQENEADEAAFAAVLRQNYDVREVPKLYAILQTSVRQDQRVGLAFIGNKRRTAERLANAEDVVGRTLKAEIDAKQGRFVATQPEFVRVMSSLRRDNGILSFYNDMFQLAKSNLEFAQQNRPNDPAAHYYYGKVLKLVGRTEEDRKAADAAFQKAIDFDHRERNYGAHFYRALALIDQKDPGLKPAIAKELQAYLMASIRFASEEAAFANALPANLDDMYDYLAEAGDIEWRAIVPDDLKSTLTQVGTQKEKTESPVNKAQAPPRAVPANPRPRPATAPSAIKKVDGAVER